MKKCLNTPPTCFHLDLRRAMSRQQDNAHGWPLLAYVGDKIKTLPVIACGQL